MSDVDVLRLLLVDWGAASRKEASRSRISGTALTMSQKTLAYLADPPFEHEHHAASQHTYVYTEADELESAAKSVLLILSPTLKRSLRQRLAGVNKPTSFSLLWQSWNDVLSHHDLLPLCRDMKYRAVADWLTSNDRLFFYQQAVEE